MNIYQRLNEVRKAVSYIRKDKRVENYMAVTHDAVTAEVREHFITQGIMIVPSEIESRMLDTGMVSAKGTPSMRYEAKYIIKFVNIEQPEDCIDIVLTSHALDFGDKAPGKAISYATKYAILKLLSIETGENEEGREVVKPKKTTSPTDGVLDKLPLDKQVAANDDAEYIVQCWEEDKKSDAFDAYMTLLEGDQEYMIAVWSILKPHSKIRSELKRMKAEREQNNA